MGCYFCGCRKLERSETCCLPASAPFSTSCAAEAMRSAADTQVPPNLCTCVASVTKQVKRVQGTRHRIASRKASESSGQPCALRRS